MARRTITIDEKIERARKEVIKAKEKYDAAVNELKELQERKKEIQRSGFLSLKTMTKLFFVDTMPSMWKSSEKDKTQKAIACEVSKAASSLK